jgi:FHA domain/Domain of unknown function (DUF1707)
MAGSAADTPTSPDFFRISDVDRDRAVDALKQEFVDGRLSHETFMLRMNVALGARNHGQLSGLFTDLPPRESKRARARAAMGKLRRGARDAIEDGAAAVADGFHAMLPRRGMPDLPDDAHEYTGAALARPSGPPQPLMFPSGTDASFTIGRDQHCDLYIADMSVSRLHARLTRDGEGWLLTDLGSTNGTRLNGWRVREPLPVRPGDQIRFGSASFIVQAPGG